MIPLYIFVVVTLIAVTAIATHFIGSPDFEAQVIKSLPAKIKDFIIIKGGRALIYGITAAFIFFGGALLGINPALLTSTTLGLISVFIVCRQRSPRGCFFASTGGAWGYTLATGGEVLFNGKQSFISQWLAEKLSRVKFADAIAAKDKAKLLKYGISYCLVHNTYIFIAAAPFLTCFVNKFNILTVPIGLLSAVAYILTDKMTPDTVDPIPASEWINGALVYGLYIALNLVMAQYFGALI